MSHSFLRDSVIKAVPSKRWSCTLIGKTLLQHLFRSYKKGKIFILFCMIGFFLPLTMVQAQQALGVRWDPPQNVPQAIAELQQFHETGIRTVELESLPPDQVWKAIQDQDISVHGILGISFPTAYTFSQADSAFKERMQRKVSALADQPSINALQLFEFGAVDQTDFREQLNIFFSGLDTSAIQTYYSGNRTAESLSDLPVDFMIYEITLSSKRNHLANLPTDETIGGYRYLPSGELQYKLKPLKQVMEQLSNYPNRILFFEGPWVLTMLEKHPELKNILHSLSTDSEFIFPVPEESIPGATQPPLTIIIFLLVWTSIGYHYHMSPLYRKSIFRYFTGHTFFVNDIFRRHIRSSIPALVIIAQHALLVSAALYAVFNTFWSPLGLRALHVHFPSLFFFGASSYVIFLLTFCSVLLFSLVSILWLYFSHSSLRSITQIMTLLAWPLQINFLFATGVLALYVSGGSVQMLLALTVSIFIVGVGGFLITAWDASRSLTTKKVKYLFLTVGLYLLILSAAVIWVAVFNDSFWAAIDLSLQLK